MRTKPLVHALSIGLALCLWEWLARKGLLNVFFTGSPSGILASLRGLLAGGALPGHALKSLQNLLAGYSLAVIAAVSLGIPAGFSARVYENIKGYAQWLYAIPMLVLIPLFILWFGVGDAAKIAIVFVMAFFTVFIAAMEAAKGADRQLADVCRVYRAGRLFTLLYLALPASAEPIFAGAKLAAGRAVTGMILGETFGRAEGLGYLLFHFGALYSVNDMMASLVLILALSQALFWGITALERKLIVWKR